MNICADNLSVTLGKFRLENVNIEIPEGEIFAIIGETGSGKSVLLESLAGFYQPQSGGVTYDGINVRDIPLESRQIGYVYQDNALFPHMTVRKNIEFGPRMNGLPKEEYRQEALRLMKLLKIDHIADRMPGNLSGGEQSRTALARALILKPRVLFMDEPFSALDPNTREQMYGIIENVHRNLGCTIIFVTHDFHEAERLAGGVGIVIRGELKAVCPADQLSDQTEDPEVAAFLGLESRDRTE